LNQSGLAELFLARLGRGAARSALGVRRRGRANSNVRDFVRRLRPDSDGEAHPPLSLLHLSEDLDLELTRPRYAVNPQPAWLLIELDVLPRVLLVAASLSVEALQRFEVAGVESSDEFSERLSGGRVRQLAPRLRCGRL